MNDPEYLIPEAPIARQLHIANLLSVVNYSQVISPGGELIRREALRRALHLLDLDNIPST